MNGSHSGLHERDAAEIARRRDLIRQAKAERLGRGLRPEELDRLVEPVRCRRTRERVVSAEGGD